MSFTFPFRGPAVAVAPAAIVAKVFLAVSVVCRSLVIPTSISPWVARLPVPAMSFTTRTVVAFLSPIIAPAVLHHLFNVTNRPLSFNFLTVKKYRIFD